jgi:hypothetical protein
MAAPDLSCIFLLALFLCFPNNKKASRFPGRLLVNIFRLRLSSPVYPRSIRRRFRRIIEITGRLGATRAGAHSAPAITGGVPVSILIIISRVLAQRISF